LNGFAQLCPKVKPEVKPLSIPLNGFMFLALATRFSSSSVSFQFH